MTLNVGGNLIIYGNIENSFNVGGQDTNLGSQPRQGARGQGAQGQGAPNNGAAGQGAPGQGSPSHATPGQGPSGQGSPGQGSPGQVSPGHRAPGQGAGGPGTGGPGAGGQGAGGHAAPGHGSPGHGSPGQGSPGQGTPGQAALGYAAPGQGAPGYAALGKGAPGYAAPGQGSPDQGAPGYAAPGQGSPSQGSPGQGSPGHSAPGQGAPDGADCDDRETQRKQYCGEAFNIVQVVRPKDINQFKGKANNNLEYFNQLKTFQIPIHMTKLFKRINELKDFVDNHEMELIKLVCKWVETIDYKTLSTNFPCLCLLLKCELITSNDTCVILIKEKHKFITCPCKQLPNQSTFPEARNAQIQDVENTRGSDSYNEMYQQESQCLTGQSNAQRCFGWNQYDLREEYLLVGPITEIRVADDAALANTPDENHRERQIDMREHVPRNATHRDNSNVNILPTNNLSESYISSTASESPASTEFNQYGTDRRQHYHVA